MPERYSIDIGNPLIAVPNNRSANRCSIRPMISGNNLNFKRPEKFKVEGNFRAIMEFGRHSIFLQPFKFNWTIPDKSTIDNNSPLISVPSKRSCHKNFIFPTISGNFFNFEQQESTNVFGDFIKINLKFWKGCEDVHRMNIKFWKVIYHAFDYFSSLKIIKADDKCRLGCEDVHKIIYA